MTQTNNNKIFDPAKLAKEERVQLATMISKLDGEEPHDAIMAYRQQAKEAVNADDGDARTNERLSIAVCFSLLADFLEQGWFVALQGDQITIRQPTLDEIESETEAQVKNRIRKGFEAISNRQLCDPSNREFRRRMEMRREHQGRLVSVLDVIDDGESLAHDLRKLKTVSSDNVPDLLSNAIIPEIVECRGDEKCLHTGLRLQDIWRYFRHTWSLEYKLLPGRTMRLLVRNAARPNHPVIGIVLLSSPTANLLSRDKWIGWTLNELVTGLLEKRWAASDIGKILFEAIKSAIKEIRTNDLVPPNALNHPKKEHFFALDQIVHKATHGRIRDLEGHDSGMIVDIRGLDKEKITNAKWKELSETSLFVKKRAEQLIPLLNALRTMKGFGFDKDPGAALYEALVESGGKKAVQTALNEMKKVRLASEVADLSVCGAVAPYNKLIGGKLVAALMASNKVREIYRDRYGKQVSEIASQIKGKRVIRSTNLKLLTTTALYGVGSNQYSSLNLRTSRNPELESDIVWKKIDSSEGFTVTHISDETVSLMRTLSIGVHGRRRINSVFGEGSSPRTRQIRDGLNLLGINNDDLLRQPNKKKVYGCELYPGAKNQLLGFTRENGNQIAKSNSVSSITIAWARRWLMPRLKRDDTLEDLALIKPVHTAELLTSRAAKYSEIRSD